MPTEGGRIALGLLHVAPTDVQPGSGLLNGFSAIILGFPQRRAAGSYLIVNHHGEHAKPGEAVWLIDVNGFWVNGKQVFSDGPSLMPIEGWQDTVLPLK